MVKYPQTQNEVFRLMDVSAFAYVVGVLAFYCTVLFLPFWYQIVLYACGGFAMLLAFFGFYVSFKVKAKLRKENKWVNLSFREKIDLHWWRKGA